MCKEHMPSETIRLGRVIQYVTCSPGAKSTVTGLGRWERPSQRSAGPTWLCALLTRSDRGRLLESDRNKGTRRKSPRSIWWEFKLVYTLEHKSREDVGDTPGKEDCGQIKTVLHLRIEFGLYLADGK